MTALFAPEPTDDQSQQPSGTQDATDHSSASQGPVNNIAQSDDIVPPIKEPEKKKQKAKATSHLGLSSLDAPPHPPPGGTVPPPPPVAMTEEQEIEKKAEESGVVSEVAETMPTKDESQPTKIINEAVPTDESSPPPPGAPSTLEQVESAKPKKEQPEQEEPKVADQPRVDEPPAKEPVQPAEDPVIPPAISQPPVKPSTPKEPESTEKPIADEQQVAAEPVKLTEDDLKIVEPKPKKTPKKDSEPIPIEESMHKLKVEPTKEPEAVKAEPEEKKEKEEVINISEKDEEQQAEPVKPQQPQEPSEPQELKIEQPKESTSNEHQTLADILLSEGKLDDKQAEQIKLAEIQTGKPQEEIISEQTDVSETDLVKAKAQFYKVPYIDLVNSPISPDALAVLPREVAQKFEVFPVSLNRVDKELVLAMAEPLNITAIEFIEQKTGMKVSPHAAEPSKVNEFISTKYSTSLSKEVTEALKEVGEDKSKRNLNVLTQRTGVVREEKVSEIVNHILEFAMKARASDVHIEPEETSTRVRYRIDGILQEKLTIPRGLHDALVSRIKILSGMKIDEKRIPQDGRFNFQANSQEVDLRVSTLPTAWGEKIVMRLLKKTGGVPDLTELGLRGRALKNLEEAILRPHGIITITGPTGSGKTTTLYSIIQRLNTPKVNIMTLEDPIEYKIRGVNQVQVNPGAGLTFASGLRSFLRQDPNIILVGEIRDKETAGLAIQASLTGHLVFSTLHTNDASGALPRLMDMKAEPFLLASSMTCIVGQRVLRRIDPETKEAYEPDPEVKADIREVLGPLFPADKPIKLYKGKPRPENNNSGYIGRIGIYEVLPVTEKIARLILEQKTAADIQKAAVAEGMITMKQDGYLKAVEGITTLEEVLRVAQE